MRANRRQKVIRSMALIFGLLSSLSCGVKGDPLPPDRPAELGRGRPTYRRATERLKVVPVEAQTSESSEVIEEEE